MGDTRWKTSVTVAAIVEHGGRYLLVEEHTPDGLMLNNPAGHRSAPPADVTFLRLAFSGEVGEPLPGRALDAEIVRTLWLTPDELRAQAARHRSPLVMRCVDDHRAGRRYPLDLVFSHASVLGP